MAHIVSNSCSRVAIFAARFGVLVTVTFGLFAAHTSVSAASLCPPELGALAEQADLVLRGRIETTDSFWNENHSQIESRHLLRVRYALKGESPDAVALRAPGGYLPAEDIGMLDSNAVTFATGEEVIVFLDRQGEELTIVQSETGKFLVHNGVVKNLALGTAQPLGQFYAALNCSAPAVDAPDGWELREPPTLQAGAVDSPTGFVHSGLKWPANAIRYRVNINTVHAGGTAGSAADFLQAIQAAADAWSFVSGADFSLLYDGATGATNTGFDGVNEVLFVNRGLQDANGGPQPAGQARIWYNSSNIVKEADLWINDAYQWNVTGDLELELLDLQSAVLHEFGHWLVLDHDGEDAAVMNAFLTVGTSKRSLHSDDIAGIESVYPCPAVSFPCNPPGTPVPAPTKAPVPAATPPPQPTPSPTPEPPEVVASITVEPGQSALLAYLAVDEDVHVELDIPAGAVTQTTVIRLKSVQLPAPPPENLVLVSPVFSLDALQNDNEVADFTFAQSVTLTLSAPTGAAQAGSHAAGNLYFYDSDASRWAQTTCLGDGEELGSSDARTHVCVLSPFALFQEGRRELLFLPLVVR